jgi:DNA modification methylase
MHPTQKPVEINQRVLENFTEIGDTVLDLFG